MRRLRDLTGETVNLGVPDGGDIVFVAQVESREMVRAMARPGFRASLHCTAMGQAILARGDDAEVAQFLRTYGLPRATHNTIARASRLNDTLAEVRRVGYAIDDEHNMVGLRCIAAAVGDEYQQPVAAISLVGPTLRIKTSDFERLGEAVLEAAQEASQAFCGATFHTKKHANH
jgi:IclR family acetate operon transcriptional repressor